MKHLDIPEGLFETTDQTVVPLSDGGCGVLDHGIQCLVATGTEEECLVYVMGETRYLEWKELMEEAIA